MKCEYCKKEHDGKYGSGRFCSCKCARGFSSKEKRAEINEKVSKTLRKDKALNDLTKQQYAQKKCAQKHAAYVRKIEVASILDLSKRTVSKILRRMNLGCSRCGWNEDVCDLHHIIPKKNGGTNAHINLTYICPNCHRLIGNNKFDSKELISFWDYVGDEWKKFYFTKVE